MSTTVATDQIWALRGFAPTLENEGETGNYVYALVVAPDAAGALAAADGIRFAGGAVRWLEADWTPEERARYLTPLTGRQTGACFGYFGEGGEVEPDPEPGAASATRWWHVRVSLQLEPDASLSPVVRAVMNALMRGAEGAGGRPMGIVIEAPDARTASRAAERAARAMYEDDMEYPYRSPLPVLGVEALEAHPLIARPSGVALVVLDLQGLGGPTAD